MRVCFVVDGQEVIAAVTGIVMKRDSDGVFSGMLLLLPQKPYIFLDDITEEDACAIRDSLYINGRADISGFFQSPLSIEQYLKQYFCGQSESSPGRLVF